MRKLKIDIVFCDLDHTIVGLAQQKTTEHNKKMIARLRKNNKLFVIATGRSLERSIFISKALNADYGIFSNGGLVYSFIDDKVVATFPFSNELLSVFLQNCSLKDQIFFTFYCTDSQNSLVSFYLGQQNKQFFEQQVDLTNFKKLKKAEDLRSYSVFRINVYGSKQPLSEVAKKLDSDRFSQVFNYPTVLEVNAQNISKGSATTFLLKKTNIPKDRALAFGDGANDIQMFRVVKYGIAVANANIQLKKIAYEEADNYHHSGVGKALER